MKPRKFPTSVAERIGYYVYTLADPRTGKVIYVGKGKGNRIFAHANAAIRKATKSDKLEQIRKILANGRSVQHELIRHGMTEPEALEVESALIDYVGLRNLVNEVGGHDSDVRGRMSTDEVIAHYQARPIKIKEPVLLIIVNRLFERNISAERLYDVTRGNWDVGPRRNKAKYAFSVYKGIVRQVYRVDRWFQTKARSGKQKRQRRWRFTGEIAIDLRHYVGGSVERYLKRGARRPTRYVNC